VSKNKFRIIKKYGFLLLLLLPFLAQGQKLELSVKDRESGNALNSCVIVIENNGSETIGYTNELGKYSNVLKEGAKYTIQLSYVGYTDLKDTFTIRNSIVEKEYFLTPTAIQGAAAIISANLIPSTNTLAINKENFLKLPGSFNDPSRLLIKFPGIASTNDQANFVTLRGMPPSMAGWYVNGASVVNPNHLSNTGTFTDQASASGGGVNMISGNSIANFEFVQAPLGNEYFHVGSGLSDFKLDVREGLVFSAGLLGTEAGYGVKKGRVNLGANYRYSTLGILSALGVPLGDEKINFQDLHLHVSSSGTNYEWSVDGIAGINSNVHESLGEASVFFKDALDVDFRASQMLVSGVYNVWRDKWRLDNTVNYSGRLARRNVVWDEEILNRGIAFSEVTEEERVSMRNRFVYGLTSKVDVGYVQHVSRGRICQGNGDTNLEDYVGLATVDWKSGRWLVSGGVGYTRIGNGALGGMRWSYKGGSEGRFLLKYFNNKNRVSGQLSRQVVPVLNQFRAIDVENVPMTSHNASIDYIREEIWGKIKVGAFYHQFENVLVSEIDQVSYFSREDLLTSSLQAGNMANNGKMDISGFLFQFQLDRKVLQFLQSNSIYNVNSVGNIINDYDFRFTSSSTLSYSRKFRKNLLILSTSYQARGGNVEFRIDEEASTLTTSTVYDRSVINRLSPYTRMDLKVNYLWGKEIGNEKKYKLSLDIQNLLNRQNDSYSYFDPLAQEVILQNQLGIIPILRFTWIVF